MRPKARPGGASSAAPAAANKAAAPEAVPDVAATSLPPPQQHSSHLYSGGGDGVTSDAAHCVASGRALANAIVRQRNSFSIAAHSADGTKRTSGGDHFFIAVRGCGARVRARVLDNDDGSYGVTFKPEIAGTYKIAISLYGEPLPGSPFRCSAQSLTPVAAKCELRGEALRVAVARVQQHFDITFRDATGQLAHAEELDVYVEPIAGSGGGGGTGMDAAASSSSPSSRPMKAAGRSGSPPKQDDSASLLEKPKGKAAPQQEPQAPHQSPSPHQMKPPPPPPPPAAVPPSARPGARGNKMRVLLPDGSLHWAWEVVSNRPLVVREAEATQSARVGQLPAGKRLVIFDRDPQNEAGGGGGGGGGGDNGSDGGLADTFASSFMNLLSGHAAGQAAATAPSSDGSGGHGPAVRAQAAMYEEDANELYVTSPRPTGGDGADGGGKTPTSPFLTPTKQVVGNTTFLMMPQRGGSGGGGGAAADSWLSTYVSKPSWYEADEEIEARASPRLFGSPRQLSPHASPRQTSPRSARGGHSRGLGGGGGGGGGTVRPIGWVTIAKDGKELVSTATQLDAAARQQHLQAWERRRAVDKSLAARQDQQAFARSGRSTKALEASSLSSPDHRQDRSGGGSGGGSHGVTASSSSSSSSAGGGGGSVFQHEVSADPTGIGFAYGGMDPGRLHAHGKVVETHKVFYSICLVGTYWLHVGLRSQNMPIPGSPYKLEVVAGPAFAQATALPADTLLPLLGVVGYSDAEGCHLRLRARDKMRNLCDSGGASVTCASLGEKGREHVAAHVKDNADGTYSIVWRSKRSGRYDVHVLIDGVPIEGSPFPMELAANPPEIGKTQPEGDGLTRVKAGCPATVLLKLFDEYGNPSRAREGLRFGCTLVRADERKEEKLRWKGASHPSDPYEGAEMADGYAMVYVPTLAGEMELHLWCADTGKSESSAAARHALPGSPHRVFCVAGDAHAPSSHIDGFCVAEVVQDPKEKAKNKVLERQQGSSSSSSSSSGGGASVAQQRMERMERASERASTLYPSGSEVGAGEVLIIKPTIHDAFGNPATAELGGLELRISVDFPDGQICELEALSHVRGGLTAYETRFEPRVKGEYQVRISVGEVAIEASPLRFVVLSGFPDVAKCWFVPPPPPLYASTEYDVTLVTADKWGNECGKGGAHVSGRIASGLVGHSLPAGQDTDIDVVDLGTGSYALKLLMRAASEIKLIVSIAREKPSPTAASVPGQILDFPPLQLAFQNRGRDESKARRASQQENGRDKSPSRPPPPAGAPSARLGTSLLKKAEEMRNRWKTGGEAVMEGFGVAGERRQKDAVLLAAEAFHEAGAQQQQLLGGRDMGREQPAPAPAPASERV